MNGFLYLRNTFEITRPQENKCKLTRLLDHCKRRILNKQRELTYLIIFTTKRRFLLWRLCRRRLFCEPSQTSSAGILPQRNQVRLPVFLLPGSLHLRLELPLFGEIQLQDHRSECALEDYGATNKLVDLYRWNSKFMLCNWNTWVLGTVACNQFSLRHLSRAQDHRNEYDNLFTAKGVD